MDKHSAELKDWNTWNHYPVYSFFDKINFPFFHLSFPLDVTRLKMYTKQKNLSFYLAMIYFITESLNEIEAFRYRIRDNRLWLLSELHPSFTFMKKGNEIFQIAVCEMKQDLFEFCRYASDKIENQQQFITFGEEIPADAFVYLSCLPWLELTSVSNERNIDVNDAIPRITWGKYVEEGEQLKLTLSVEVNHKFVDGYHVAKLANLLQQKINGLI